MSDDLILGFIIGVNSMGIFAAYLIMKIKSQARSGNE